MAVGQRRQLRSDRRKEIHFDLPVTGENLSKIRCGISLAAIGKHSLIIVVDEAFAETFRHGFPWIGGVSDFPHMVGAAKPENPLQFCNKQKFRLICPHYWPPLRSIIVLKKGTLYGSFLFIL